MEPTPTPPDPRFPLPDPDAIRAAIAATDERARLLRWLLRVRLQLPAAGDHFPAPTPTEEAARG